MVDYKLYHLQYFSIYQICISPKCDPMPVSVKSPLATYVESTLTGTPHAPSMSHQNMASKDTQYIEID